MKHKFKKNSFILFFIEEYKSNQDNVEQARVAVLEYKKATKWISTERYSYKEELQNSPKS